MAKKLNYIRAITIQGHKSFIRFMLNDENAIVKAYKGDNLDFIFYIQVDKSEKVLRVLSRYEKEFPGVTFRFMPD